MHFGVEYVCDCACVTADASFVNCLDVISCKGASKAPSVLRFLQKQNSDRVSTVDYDPTIYHTTQSMPLRSTYAVINFYRIAYFK